MSILYQNLGKSIALRANQLGDAASAAALEIRYRDTGLEVAMEGADVPYTALKRDILAAEKILATMIGKSGDYSLMSDMIERLPVTSGDTVPATVGDRQVLKVLDGVYNASDDNPLQRVDKQTVMRLIRNAGSFYKLIHDCYAIDGDAMLYFICSSKPTVQCCGCQTACYCEPGTAYMRAVVWDETLAGVNFDDVAGVSPLPSRCERLLMYMVLAGLAQETYFGEAAGYYGGLAKEEMAALGLIGA